MRKRISPGVILGVIAVLLAATGSAAAGTLITSAKIKDGTIQSRDIQNGAIAANKLSASIRRQLANTNFTAAKGEKGDKGDKGDAGAPGTTLQGSPPQKGDKGDKGADGRDGISGYEVRTWDYIAGGHRPGKDGEDSSYGGAGNSSIATVACSSQDKVAISGGYFIRNGGDDTADSNSPAWAFRSSSLGQGAGVIASFPGRMDWTTNTPKPNRLDGWIVQFNGNGPVMDVTLYTVCVNAG